jgi:hypothetical protein
MARKLPYSVGDWFAVPLRSRGYGVGLIARSAKGGKILLGYFFGPRRDELPALKELSSLRAADAVGAYMFGDLSLFKKEWPIIGPSTPWIPKLWPMPSFVREDLLTGVFYKVDYADDDPLTIVSETRLTSFNGGLERDGLCGAGAVEIALTCLLDP